LRAGNAARLARRGLLSNLLLGDFVEACYPFTLPSTPLLAAVRTGASLAGAVLFVRGVDRCLSSAYLPLPLAMWAVRARGTSSDVGTFIAALAVAFVVPFVAALIILRGRTDKTL
jgi:mannitol-specific phosphotransferase system IIBC component